MLLRRLPRPTAALSHALLPLLLAAPWAAAAPPAPSGPIVSLGASAPPAASSPIVPHGIAAPQAPPGAHFVPVSAAGAELMREIWDSGGLRNNARVQALVERLREADLYDITPGERPAIEATPSPPRIEQFLGNDVIVNDRALSDNCTCNGRPISQAEPSVAAWGPYVVASWNDRRLACVGLTSARQGHAWSRDFGATFHEGFLLTGPQPTDTFRGDPTVAVNRKTGAFYISGLFSGGGVVAVRGHFDPDSFAIDLRKVIGRSMTGDFHDKPWMAVDSVSGNVYVTWTNFHADYSLGIELQRLDADLNPLGPVQVIHLAPYGGYFYPQDSYPTVGPDGELHVAYGLYYGDSTTIFGNTPSRFEVVRSDDGGSTFGPPHVIAEFGDNLVYRPPGNQRGFYASLVAMDVDRTRGPHRGRVYASWSEVRPLSNPITTGASVFEREKNDFFARATSFTPGDKLRGVGTDIERDIFKFTGQKGDVFYMQPDTVNTLLHAYLLCPADTSALANWHLLGIDLGGCGLPYDGTYYLVLDSPFHNNGSYVFSTALIPPTPGFRARDVRDQFMAYSDDGATWSTPVRLNDDPAGFDAEHTQIAVDGRGRVHAFWFDWRDDPDCGTTSNQYAVSSGDGGVTWGPNRRMTDVSSFWGALASCSSNNHGDYMQMAADGDHVYAAFPDSRLGDPDVFLDASVYRSTGQCPANQTVPADMDAMIAFSLANGGNFATPLAWRLVDDAGWITGAIPGTSGVQTLAANGGSVTVVATLHPPAGCGMDSTTVRFITGDPSIPGAYDTCTTVVRCDGVVPVLLSLVERRVSGDRVWLRWFAADAAGAQATVSRRSDGAEWTWIGTATVEAGGYVSFEDRGVPPGLYGYRIAIESAAHGTLESELWIEVPALALSLRGSTPNPTRRGPPAITFSLRSSAAAVLEVHDLGGRRLASRAVGALGPGSHELRLSELGALPSGVYVVRLRQDGAEVTRNMVVVH